MLQLIVLRVAPCLQLAPLLCRLAGSLHLNPSCPFHYLQSVAVRLTQYLPRA